MFAPSITVNLYWLRRHNPALLLLHFLLLRLGDNARYRFAIKPYRIICTRQSADKVRKHPQHNPTKFPLLGTTPGATSRTTSGKFRENREVYGAAAMTEAIVVVGELCRTVTIGFVEPWSVSLFRQIRSDIRGNFQRKIAIAKV